MNSNVPKRTKKFIEMCNKTKQIIIKKMGRKMILGKCFETKFITKNTSQEPN